MEPVLKLKKATELEQFTIYTATFADQPVTLVVSLAFGRDDEVGLLRIPPDGIPDPATN